MNIIFDKGSSKLITYAQSSTISGGLGRNIRQPLTQNFALFKFLQDFLARALGTSHRETPE